MTREQIHMGDMSHKTAIDILKLMLEAMETYDGISPTPARINAIKMAIEVLDQETKTGHWEKYGPPRCGEQHYQCTLCGYYINFGKWGKLYTKEFKFCPNCGAKMIKEQESEE